MLEKTIEKKVCDYAKSLGWEVFKFSSPGQRGVPDRILLKDSRCVFIEFKAPGKKPTVLQERIIDRLKRNGFTVLVIDNVEEGKRSVAAL